MVSVVGRHNAGKTTFLSTLLPALLGRGLRVAVIKHAAQGFSIDRPGTDSERIARTGVEQTLLVGRDRLAVVESWEMEPELFEVIARHVRPEVDLVLTEGYKKEPHPKVEVARAAISTELVAREEELLAVVCDFQPRTAAKVFGFSDAEEVADFIVERVVNR